MKEIPKCCHSSLIQVNDIISALTLFIKYLILIIVACFFYLLFCTVYDLLCFLSCVLWFLVYIYLVLNSS